MADARNDDTGKSGLLSQSVRGVLWSSIERGGTAVVATAVQIVLVRVLAPQAFGLVAMAYVAINFLSLFKDQGFEAALVQREKLDDEHLDAALWTLLGTSVVLVGIGAASSPLLATFFGEPRLAPVLTCLMLSIPLLSAQSIPAALLKRRMHFKPLSIRALIASLAGGAVAVFLALEGFGVWSLVVKTLVHHTVGLVVIWSAAGWRPRLRFSRSHFDDLFGFGVNVTFERLVNYVNRNLDDILIGFFLGPTALGFYTVAYDILKGMTQTLSRTFASVALPSFSRLQPDRLQLRSAFLGAVEVIGIFVFPIFSTFIAIAPGFFLTVYGDKWAPSIPVAQILALIGMLHSVALLNGPLLKACNRPDWSLRLTAINAAGNALAFSIAVHYGIVWVAAAYVIRNYIHLPLTLSYVARLTDMTARDYLGKVTFPLLGAGVAYAAARATVEWVPDAPALSTVLAILAALAAYAVFLAVLTPAPARQLLRRVFSELRPS